MPYADAFDRSYDRLFGHSVKLDERSETFFERFYERFLEHPEVAELFEGTDMQRQITMLRKSFFHLLGFAVSGSPSQELERIAKIHDSLAVPKALFDHWLDCLIATVAELDEAATPETLLAWRLALAQGAVFMTHWSGHLGAAGEAPDSR